MASGTFQNKPSTILWFKVYCTVLSMMYLFLVAFGIVIMTSGIYSKDFSPEEMAIIAVGFIATGAVLFCVCVLPFFVKPKPWVWVYDLVVICIGMTSICFLPFCTPLLIFWMKPEMKAYFGRGDA